MFVDALSWWERCTYWIVGVSGLAYSIYNVFIEGNKYKNALWRASFTPGWSWIGRDQDQSDRQWLVWLSTLSNKILLNTIHVLLSQTCFYFKVSVKLHTCVLLICDLVAAYFFLGIRTVVLQFTTALMMYAVSLLGSTTCVWLMAVALMSLLNSTTVVKYWKFLDFFEIFHFFVTSAFFFSRLQSFAIEKVRYGKSIVAKTDVNKHICHTGHYKENERPKLCDSSFESKNKFTTDKLQKGGNESSDLSSLNQRTNMPIVDSDPSLIDLLFYSFYLPTLFGGPFILYVDFHNQVKNAFRSSDFSPDVYDIIKKLVRISFWAVFIEFQLHFLYFSAFGANARLVDRLSTWVVAGVGYCQGQFFMIKYLVFYGTAIQLSRFDGIVPIATPRCIGWVYSYKDMWKHFDVGLYNFIKTYVYIPLGGSRVGFLRQIFASSLTFIFIYYWHGTREDIFIWCVGNHLMGSLEVTAITLAQTSAGIKLKSLLGPAMWLRLKAFFITTAYLVSTMLSQFFFFNVEFGWIFVRKMITKVSWTTLVTEFIIFNACIHNALYLEQWFDYKKKEKAEKSRK